MMFGMMFRDAIEAQERITALTTSRSSAKLRHLSKEVNGHSISFGKRILAILKVQDFQLTGVKEGLRHMEDYFAYSAESHT